MHDQAGAGIGNAAVMVTGGTAPTPEIAIRSRPDGSFRIGLPSGSFVVAAYAGDGRQARAEVVVNDAPVEIDLLLLPSS